MELRPVSQPTAPAYPTRREFLAAAAALTAAGISGCGGEGEPSPRVAPIFAHGEGRGAIGCVVMSPPEFLSEEEALLVVREELAKAGVTLGEGLPLPEVTVDYQDPMSGMIRSDDWLGDSVEDPSQGLKLTAVDPQQRVGVAVVTRNDCDRFSSGMWISTVSSYDTKELAQSVASALREQAKQDLRIGVFYDPLEKWNFMGSDDEDSGGGETASDGGETVDPDDRFERMLRNVKERSRAQLRRQVREFVAWLKENR